MIRLCFAVSSLVLQAIRAEDAIFFGEDIAAGDNVQSGQGFLTNPELFPNSDAARNEFFASIDAEVFEDFNSLPVGTYPSISGTTASGVSYTIKFFIINDSMEEESRDITIADVNTDLFGPFDVFPVGMEGSTFMANNNTEKNVFKIEFSEPVSAFGFLGWENDAVQLDCKLIFADGSEKIIEVPHSLSSISDTMSLDNSFLWFSLIHKTTPLVAIHLLKNGLRDGYGIDLLTVGKSTDIIGFGNNCLEDANCGCCLCCSTTARLRRLLYGASGNSCDVCTN